MIWNRKNPRKSSTFEQFSKQNLVFEQLFSKSENFGEIWSNLIKSLSPEHFHFFWFLKFLHFHTAMVDLWWSDSTKNTRISSLKFALSLQEIKVNKNTKICKKFHLNKNTPENCMDCHIFSCFSKNAMLVLNQEWTNFTVFREDYENSPTNKQQNMIIKGGSWLREPIQSGYGYRISSRNKEPPFI